MEELLTRRQRFLNFIDKNWLYLFIAILFLLSFACLFNLWTLPVEDWDEARHGINAFEMLKQNNFIANYYQGELDYWNLKPPISYWFIMIGYKIFGFNAFGLRFFSALSYIITALVVSLFIKNKLGKFESLISALFFTSFSYLFIMHCVRTGDADALFLLFYTISMIALIKSSDNANWLFLTGTCFALAFLTKSWHAFIIVPAVFFYMLFTKGFKNTKWWQYIVFFFCSVLPILLWGLLRFNFDGVTFFKGMIEYDLLSRTSSALENHSGSVFYYFLLLGLIPTMLVAVVLGIVQLIIKIRRKEKLSNISILCLTSFLTTFIIFSIAKTKLGWYIFPCTIPSAIYGAYILGRHFKCSDETKPAKKFKIASIVCLCFVCLFSVLTMATPFVKITEMDTTSQQFISEIKIEDNNNVYMQIKNETKWNQGNLLVLEFTIGRHGLDGGYNEFVLDKGSYLIIDKETYNTFDKTNTQTVKENDLWILIKNISV